MAMSRTLSHSPQAPAAVVMVRPQHFTPNPETAADNRFQRQAPIDQAQRIAQAAHQEVGAAAQVLRQHGVRVHLFDDDGRRDTPDSVFPNNWFSTHAGGHVALYPMYSPNRRRERRDDVLDLLKCQYRVQDVIDYTGLVHDGLFLEGTGAMVLDHLERVAYTARSNRAHPLALERFCTQFNYEPMEFGTLAADGCPVYHTNVLMSVATEFALIGLDLIDNPVRAQQIRHRLEQSGREVIVLDPHQIAQFAGNALELTGAEGRLLALSETAFNSLRPPQKAAIERSARLLPLAVPTIELAGGSVRCMLAGIHLSAR